MGSELLALLEARAGDDVHALSDDELCLQVEELTEAIDRAHALLCRRMQAAEVKESTVMVYGRTPRATLVEEHRRAPAEASKLMFVARRLPSRPMLAAAFDDGRITLEHARLIASCLESLPADWHEQAESILVEAASHMDPLSLRPVIDKLRVASGADDTAAERAERKYADRWVRTSTTFDGMLHLEGMLDPLTGQTVMAALNALLSVPVPEDERTTGQRTADALGELARHSLDCGGLPDVGRDRPHVVTVMDWEALQDTLTGLRDREAVATLGYGGRGSFDISPDTARMLACDAQLIPAVLGSAGEVLDLGRSSPSWTTGQHRAAALRDGGCVWPQCQAGLDRCQLHHIDWWSHGGATDIANSAHLCTFHHWLVHHRPWAIWRADHGAIHVRRT